MLFDLRKFNKRPTKTKPVSTSLKLFQAATAVMFGGVMIGAIVYNWLNFQRQFNPNNNKIIKNESITPIIPEEELGVHLYFDYILIGNSATVYSALKEILANDKEGKILIINEEEHNIYPKPILTKELMSQKILFDNCDLEKVEYEYFDENDLVKKTKIFFKMEELNVINNYDELSKNKARINILNNEKVQRVDIGRNVVYLKDSNHRVSFDKLLIGKDNTTVSLSQYLKFKEYLSNNKSNAKVRVVGSNVFALEFIYSLLDLKNVQVTNYYNRLEDSDSILNLLPDNLVDKIRDDLLKSGVQIIRNNTAPLPEEDAYTICFNAQTKLNDSVFSNLETTNDSCYVANLNLQITEDVFVAGDFLSYYDQSIKRRSNIRNSYSNQIYSGQVAGFNMAASKNNVKMKTYDFLPYLEISKNKHHDNYVSMGTCSNIMPNKQYFNTPGSKGVVFYFDNNTRSLVGISLMNLSLSEIDFAREIIRLNRFNLTDSDKLAVQFNLYD